MLLLPSLPESWEQTQTVKGQEEGQLAWSWVGRRVKWGEQCTSFLPLCLGPEQVGSQNYSDIAGCHFINITLLSQFSQKLHQIPATEISATLPFSKWNLNFVGHKVLGLLKAQCWVSSSQIVLIEEMYLKKVRSKWKEYFTSEKRENLKM